MSKSAVHAAAAPQAIGPYSQAIECDDWVFVSGQIALDASGQLAAGGVAEQTERVLRNIEAILAAAGLGLPDVIKTTVYLTDLDAFGKMNAVYAQHFCAPYPARATVEVKALPKGVAVEIEAVARRSHGQPTR